ncbi:hypothetical protein OGH69_01405 [Flavobacterium sp. MFBS3-15]|uniref:hypothetical protein n=1 Tax=Flavobacterium sp. MFBS3-15 TaxID=2989816 RepID=UPI00223553AF|nr:hypothetical protein [Flavobacterium sp. MFBS3-15]MCW4467612.1 hypothetical protein [Flavobacterium sp. MFBS3-15]
MATSKGVLADFLAWRKTDPAPRNDISRPGEVYFEFEGWGTFLGTNSVANQNKKFRSYEEAMAFLRLLKITSVKHYRELCSMGIIPADIPKSPHTFYSKQKSWISFPDFFGK